MDQNLLSWQDNVEEDVPWVKWQNQENSYKFRENQP